MRIARVALLHQPRPLASRLQEREYFMLVAAFAQAAQPLLARLQFSRHSPSQRPLSLVPPSSSHQPRTKAKTRHHAGFALGHKFAGVLLPRCIVSVERNIMV